MRTIQLAFFISETVLKTKEMDENGTSCIRISDGLNPSNSIFQTGLLCAN